MSASYTDEIPQDIAASGWQKKFTAAGPRLREAVELYTNLGYDVLLAPAEPSAESAMLNEAACADCMLMSLSRTIYTRRHGHESAPRDDTPGYRN